MINGKRGLQVVVFLGKRNRLCHLQLSVVQGHKLMIDGDFSRSESRGSNELETRVANKLPSEPKEGFLEVVVGLGRDLEILKVLLSVESDGASLHFSLLDIDLVPAQHNGDVLAHSFKITVPVGHIFIRDSRRDVEHDDTTLALNVVSISETAELFLASGVPDVEANSAIIGRERQRMNFDTEGGDVLLLEFTRQVALDKSCFASSSVANKDELKGCNLFTHGCILSK